MYIGWFKLQLPNREEMGEDRAVDGRSVKIHLSV